MVAQETSLGWILFGSLQQPPSNMKVAATVLANVKTFWEVEAVPNPIKPFLTQDEQAAEDFFKKTTIRKTDGSFQCRMLLKPDPPQLGASRNMALTRYKSLQSKFTKNPEFKKGYRAVINDYLLQGHLDPAGEPTDPERVCYLPHHAVRKRGTSELRVVFDASAKTRNGISLNDVQRKGPKLQQDNFTLLIRFWSHTVAIT